MESVVEPAMTDDEVAAAIVLLGVVLDEKPALQEILDQLLVGSEHHARDQAAVAYFRDLAESMRLILDATEPLSGLTRRRGTAEERERVAAWRAGPVG